MSALRKLAAAAVAAASIAACGGKDKPGPVEPVAGDLTVAYGGPSQNDGAMLLVVNGAITGVKVVGSHQLSSASVGPTSTRVVITGQITPGDIFRISVADVSKVSSYTVAIEAVADRTTFALGDPFSYQAMVRR